MNKSDLIKKIKDLDFDNRILEVTDMLEHTYLLYGTAFLIRQLKTCLDLAIKELESEE